MLCFRLLCSLSKTGLQDQTESLRHGEIYEDACLIFSTDPPSKDFIFPERVRLRSMYKFRNLIHYPLHAYRKFFEVFIFLVVRVPLKLTRFCLA